ncbi:hypothetical protein Hanom_Chr01g00037471 [Helianthus anomalus]
MRSVIGDAKDLKAFKNIKDMLKEGRYQDSSVGYIGGLKVMLVKKVLWDKVFTSTILWEGQHVGFDRLVCLKVDKSAGLAWVMTSVAKRIDEEIEVVWGGGKFRVWVVEVDNKKLDCIADDLVSVREEPSEMSNESVAGDDDEIEEGDTEIRE